MRPDHPEPPLTTTVTVAVRNPVPERPPGQGVADTAVLADYYARPPRPGRVLTEVQPSTYKLVD
jgi:hypothetical protein